MWYGPKPTPRGEYESRKNVTAARLAMSSAACAGSDSGLLINAARTGCGRPRDGRPRHGQRGDGGRQGDAGPAGGNGRSGGDDPRGGGGGALRIVTVVSVAAQPYRGGKGGAYPALIRAPDNGRRECAGGDDARAGSRGRAADGRRDRRGAAAAFHGR